MSIWYSVWDFIDKLLISSDVIVLGILMHSSVVTNYVLTGYMAQSLTTVVVIMIGAAAPGLGGLIGEKKYNKVTELRKEMMWISNLAGGILGSLILIWNKSFITIWVGNEHYAGFWVNCLLVVAAVQLLFIRNEAYLIDLSLNVRRKAILGLIAALVSIGASILLIQYLGIVGLCVAIVIGRLLLNIAYPYISGKFLGLPLSEQFKPMLRPWMALASLFLLSTYVGRYELAKNWVELIVYAGASIPIVFTVMFFGGFSSDQRVKLARRIVSLKSLSQ